MKNLLTVREAAKFLGIASKTLRRWEKAGRLVPQRTFGNHRRYKLEQLEDFSRKGKRILPKIEPENSSNPIPDMIPDLSSPLLKIDKTKKAVIAGNLAVMLLVSSLVVLTKTGVIKPLFKDAEVTRMASVRGLTYENKAVLGESTSSPAYVFNVNVVSEFNEDANFKKGLKVNGKTVLGDTVIGGTITTENKDLNLGTGKITASNVLYSIKAGSGLSVETGQNPTIANTGVLSVGGKTGAVALTNGTGITIDGLTITNSDTGSSQKIFKTIKIGSDSIAAGSNTDTLELIAGSGITLASNVSDKEITISSASTVYTGGTDISISGLTISNSSTLESVTDRGATTSNLLTLNGGITIGNLSGILKASSGLVSGAATTSDLTEGTNLYFTDARARSAFSATGPLVYNSSTGGLTLNYGGNLTLNGSNLDVVNNPTFSDLVSLNGGATIPANQSLTVSGNIASNLLPSATDTYNLGSSSYQFNNIYGKNLTLAGNLITSGAISGHWQRVDGLISPVNISDDFAIGGASTSSAKIYFSGTNDYATIGAKLVIAPLSDEDPSLQIRGAPSPTANIFEVTNNAGTSTFMAIDKNGVLTVGGSRMTNTGILEAGDAINLTGLSSTVVGTAVEGGWTLNGNGFTYRRAITVQNTSGSTIPVNHEITASLTGSDASQVYAQTNTQTAPYYDFRLSYGLSTEIARNVTAFASDGVTFKFQIQSAITAGNSDTYYIYYRNTSLSSIPAQYSSYESSVDIDMAETTTGWSSAHSDFALSQELVVANQGLASIKAAGGVGSVNTFATTSQGQFSTGLRNAAIANLDISGTRYIYVLGGSDGTTAQSAILKTTISSNNSGALSTMSTTLPAGSGATDGVSIAYAGTVAVDDGDETDGTLDLTNGATDCAGLGMSWNAGASTCTLQTASSNGAGPSVGANTQYGGHSFTIPSGANAGKILTVMGNTIQTTRIYDPATNTFGAGPNTGASAGRGAHSFTIPSGANAGKILTVLGNNGVTTKIYDPATNTFGTGPSLGYNAKDGAHSFTIPSGANAGKILTITGGNTTVTRIYDPATNTYDTGPDLGTAANHGSHSFTIPSGANAGKILTVLGNGSVTTKIYDPATNTYGAGPNVFRATNLGSHSFTIPSGANAGKIITIAGGTISSSNIYDPATNTFADGPLLGRGAGGGSNSFSISSGYYSGKILTVMGNSSIYTKIYDPATNTYSDGPNLVGGAAGDGSNSFTIPSGANAGKILIVLGGGGQISTIFDPGKTTFNFTTVNVANGTILTHSGNNAPTIKATGNVTIAGAINLNGLSTSGSGNGGTGQAGCNAGYDFGGGGGGGYGGAGGNGNKTGSECAANGGSSYSGFAVGSIGGTGAATDAGGNGGGAVKIISSGTINISGSITANGANGSSGWGTGGGGGSGGGIWLEANVITNTGSITVNGGSGGTGIGLSGYDEWYGGGGGGGGRIFLRYISSITQGTTTATQGTGGTPYGADGGAGVVGPSVSLAPDNQIYLIGGKNTSGNPVLTVYKSVLDGSNDPGTLATTSQAQLVEARYGHSATLVTEGSTNYIYVVGGHNGTAGVSTVYRGTIDASNNIATSPGWESQTSLSSALYNHSATNASIGGTNYIYILGGLNSSDTAQTNVYKITLNGSGGITSIADTNIDLPSARSEGSAFVTTIGTTSYLFYVGGKDENGNPTTTVYRALLDGSGNPGVFSTTGQSQLNTAIYGHGIVHATGASNKNYLYVYGGATNAAGTTVTTEVNKSTINDMTNYVATKTLASPVNMTSKNDITMDVRSDLTGAYTKFEFYDSTGGWQTCIDSSDFSSGVLTFAAAHTFYTKVCDVSAVSSANKDAISSVRYSITSSQSQAFNVYIDNIKAQASATVKSNTVTAASGLLGAADLTLKAQGTGAVLVNYSSAGAAGTGGIKVYDGAAGQIFAVTSSGTASSAAQLTLTGASASAALNILNGQDLAIKSSVGGDTGLSTVMTIKNGGNVGVGTSTPSAKFQVGNQGDGTVAVANSWNAFSDSRFKTNVNPLLSSLDKVMKLNGVSFDWISSGIPSVGFIAQDVEKIIPEIVRTDGNGFKSMDYSKLTPFLVNAIHEQQEQIASLSALISGANIQAPVASSFSAQFLDEISTTKLSIDGNTTLFGNLTVGGRTVLGDTGITGNLNIGTVTIKTTGEINNLGGDLKLQSDLTGGIDILAGKIKIAKDGSSVFAENVTFEKNVEVRGVLGAKAVRSDELRLGKSTINEISSTEISTNKAAGTTSIAAGETHRLIKADLIKIDSLIYITPLSNTNNEVLFVSKQVDGAITISVKNTQSSPIKFNFLIINQE
ncbi:tail fiber domain-containing protein [Patescibacteria group bacterium]|nr:tail fiber domain-containing protein [Patescibacteria group bacterium]